MSFFNEATYNVQIWRDFWLFVAYCLAVIIVALFFIFYSNRVLAKVLSFLINQYTWRRYNAFIQIGKQEGYTFKNLS